MSTIAITNVRVFDGSKLTELRTVVIEKGLISSLIMGDTVVDGRGGTLLPGFIDSHVHLSSMADLELAAHWGVTTMLDMATQPPELVNSLRNQTRLTDIRSCYYPASAHGGTQSKMGYPASSIVDSPEDAERFVSAQIALGADYIKLIIEDPNVKGRAALTPETVIALVKSAHRYNKRVFAHVTNQNSFRIAIDAGVDVLSHAPLEEPLSKALVEDIANKGLVTVPTMIMMRGIANKLGKISAKILAMIMSKGIVNKLRNMRKCVPLDYCNTEETVKLFIESGVLIIAGTDANADPKSPFMLKHGESLHEELELMVKAGMTPSQALNSASSLPAKLFGFDDRGVIKIGHRADLILIEGDPTTDIRTTRAIKGVWIGGIQVRG